MKRVDIFKKIGAIVLTVVVTASTWEAVSMLDASAKMTVIAVNDETGNNNDETGKSMDQKISEQIDMEIFKALSQVVTAGGPNRVVRIDGRALGIHTLSRDTIRQLARYKVDAIFTFDYMGNRYSITIPAGATPINDDIKWYGPMYLMSLYGSTATVTPIV